MPVVVSAVAGRWGLPIPLPRKILCVRGVPLGLPQTESPTGLRYVLTQSLDFGDDKLIMSLCTVRLTSCFDGVRQLKKKVFEGTQPLHTNTCLRFRAWFTDEQVIKWHAKYVSEVTRLFDTYKGRAGPDYAHKSLIFPTEGKSKRA